jgi:hypothetical protein
MAITPRKMGYRLAYLMQVGGVWTRAEYWQKFERRRQDSIYKGRFTRRHKRAGRQDA